mmetsp:Transcript_38933/g.93407  ORF Transcript_38933/g.93407 Transcript_38933/m.93407 type:complete len:212 (-) Transcript_38933:793-1428(-)
MMQLWWQKQHSSVSGGSCWGWKTRSGRDQRLANLAPAKLKLKSWAAGKCAAVARTSWKPPLSEAGKDGGALTGARDHLRLLGCHHGLHGHGAQHLRDADGAHGRGPAAREGVAVRAARALHVQVHAARGERADIQELRQLCGGRRGRFMRGEDGGLLAEVHLLEVVVDLADALVDGDWNHGAELLLAPELHLGRHREADGGEEERAVPVAA